MMQPGWKQDVLFIPDKKGRIYITCIEMETEYYVMADQNGNTVMKEGSSKATTIKRAIKQLEWTNRSSM